MNRTPKEYPLPFSGEMIRAIGKGIKNQTRRTKGLKKVNLEPDSYSNPRFDPESGLWLLDYGVHTITLKCPYGQPGDRLWIREAFCRAEVKDRPYGDPRVAYKADMEMSEGYKELEPDERPKYTPSIHMPRWASRGVLENTGVRLERLQDISEEDAKGEGLTALTKDGGRTIKYGIADRDGWPGNDDDGWSWEEWSVDPRVAYRRLWQFINGPGSWDAKPWVWVINFPFLKDMKGLNI